MTVAASATLVISTEAKRSGEISLLNSPGSIGVGDLSTQSIMGAVLVCPPYRHAAPLEMTMAAGAIGHTCGVRVDGPWTRPFGREGSEGSKGSEGSGGWWWRLRRRLCRRVVFASLRGPALTG